MSKILEIIEFRAFQKSVSKVRDGLSRYSKLFLSEKIISRTTCVKFDTKVRLTVSHSITHDMIDSVRQIMLLSIHIMTHTNNLCSLYLCECDCCLGAVVCIIGLNFLNSNHISFDIDFSIVISNYCTFRSIKT